MLYAKIVIAILAIGMVACQNNRGVDKNSKTTGGKDTAIQKKEVAFYTCPMHQDVRSEKPGKCPICDMKLVPVEKAEAPQRADDTITGQKETTFYTCPMHHDVRSEKPGKCPICEMKLVPMEKKESQGKVMDSMTTQLMLPPREQQLAGIRIDTAKQASLKGQRVLTGTTIFDPEQHRVVSAWVGGWIEQMYVRNPGEKVAVGQKLYELYSPDLLSAEKDYRLALEQKDLFKEASVDFTSTLVAMRQKLRRWGLTARQIDRLRQMEPSGKITVYSKVSGYLTQKVKQQGDHLKEGDAVLELTGNKTLWVQAELYDNELPLLASQPEIKVALEGFPGQLLSGSIVFNNPVNQKNTRIHLLNIAIDNPGGQVQPGMLAYVYLQTSPGQPGVLVPRSSVIYGEKNRYIWVAQPGNKFERRKVALGSDNATEVAVLHGVQPGEKVVTGGTYLLNSEYILRYGAGANMMGMQMSDMKMKGKSK